LIRLNLLEHRSQRNDGAIVGRRVALMVEQGKITLDQPISSIVPGLPPAWSKVTIRHCLSHTTGLPYAVEDQFNINVLDGDRDQLIAKLGAKPVLKPAGIKTARFGDSWAIIPGRADLYTNLDITPDHKWLQQRNGEPILLRPVSCITDKNPGQTTRPSRTEALRDVTAI